MEKTIVTTTWRRTIHIRLLATILAVVASTIATVHDQLQPSKRYCTFQYTDVRSKMEMIRRRKEQRMKNPGPILVVVA